MKDFKKIRNRFEKDFDFCEEDIKNIIGSDENMSKLYENGKFEAEMILNNGDPNWKKYLGYKIEKPECFSDLFKYIYESYLAWSGQDSAEIVKMSIISQEDVILVVTDGIPFVIRVLNLEEGFVLEDCELFKAEEGSVFLDKLYDVLVYINEVSPVPVHCAEYWVSRDLSSVEDIGSGSDYYLGLSEERYVNGMTAWIEGEYELAVLEVL